MDMALVTEQGGFVFARFVCWIKPRQSYNMSHWSVVCATIDGHEHVLATHINTKEEAQQRCHNIATSMIDAWDMETTSGAR